MTRLSRRTLVVLPLIWSFASAPTPTAMGQSGRDQGPEIVSLLGRPLYASAVVGDRETLEGNLSLARAELRADPDNVEKLIWVGRRLGYLWRYGEAIEVFTEGIRRHPHSAQLYRHRGHRYISTRRFRDAAEDFAMAAQLIEGEIDNVEMDGAPNEQDLPLSTLAFNVYYHLGLARYLAGDFGGAFRAYQKNVKYAARNDDSTVANADWMYMTLRRLGRAQEAARLLDSITEDMEIIENTAYHRRLLMYKGLVKPEELLDEEEAGELDLATMGYGVANWHLYHGRTDRAKALFQRVVAGNYWPAFGFIAAEADLAQLRN